MRAPGQNLIPALLAAVSESVAKPSLKCPTADSALQLQALLLQFGLMLSA
jgi:hypothetical protein